MATARTADYCVCGPKPTFEVLPSDGLGERIEGPVPSRDNFGVMREEDAAGVGLSLLLVEDDEDIREVVTDILVRKGFEIRPATHGAEALRLVTDGFRPSAVVLDLMMPKMDGASFLGLARSTVPGFADVPVIVVSAAGVAADHLLPSEAVDRWLRKPVELPILLDALADVTNSPPGRRASLRRRLLSYLSRRVDDFQRVRTALRIGDFGDVADAASSLATAVRSFGFQRLFHASERLAKASSSRDPKVVEEALRELADVVLGLQVSS